MNDVIFLIDSKNIDSELLGVTIEKQTKCRVFNFFSFEETLLYKKLNPALIIHDNVVVDFSHYQNPVKFFDISKVQAESKKSDASQVLYDLAVKLKIFIESGQ